MARCVPPRHGAIKRTGGRQKGRELTDTVDAKDTEGRKGKGRRKKKGRDSLVLPELQADGHHVLQRLEAPVWIVGVGVLSWARVVLMGGRVCDPFERGRV